MANFLREGQIVYSTRGRDRGCPFIVLRDQGHGFVLVADGEKRTVEKPKRKNLKHLREAFLVVESIAERLRQGLLPTNGEIRKELEGFMARHAVPEGKEVKTHG